MTMATFLVGKHKVTPVVPTACIRCGSTLLSYTLEADRHPALQRWQKFQFQAEADGCLSAGLTLITLGLWGFVWAFLEILRLVRDGQLEKAAMPHVAECVKTECRACALSWYPGERLS